MSSEVFDLIKFFWKHYNGKGFYLYLFLGCMVLLLFLRERRKYNRYLFWYCIGGLILFTVKEQTFCSGTGSADAVRTCL